MKFLKNCSELHAYCHILPGLPYYPFNGQLDSLDFLHTLHATLRTCQYTNKNEQYLKY